MAIGKVNIGGVFPIGKTISATKDLGLLELPVVKEFIAEETTPTPPWAITSDSFFVDYEQIKYNFNGEKISTNTSVGGDTNKRFNPLNKVFAVQQSKDIAFKMNKP